MTDLVPIFERLGLQQYVDVFAEEGFDTWGTVLYITESDLEALNVKLGHRRKLQKEIAHARGISIEQVIGSVSRRTASEEVQKGDSDTKSTTSQGDDRSSTQPPLKRKYRRHPKPDENAPERAPSAYVIFSNKIREELRPQKLSFTEIAKTVGEKWQVLSPEEKEQYESQAASAKEVYNAELAKYKRTSQYRDYQWYLVDFKARNGPSGSGGTEGKRLRLETETSSSSIGSVSGTSAGLPSHSGPYEHHRKDSLSQSGNSPSSSSVTSPAAVLQIPGGSLESVSHTSLPSTPSSTNTLLPNASSQSLPIQRGFEPARPHHLPRILPLEGRDSPKSHLPLLMSESTQYKQNPRRSKTNSPVPGFFRHDTSKSSTSSNLSSGGSIGAPVTPVDDYRILGRSLPPPTLLTQMSSGGSSIIDLAKQPTTSPTIKMPPTEQSSGKLLPALGYPNTFQHLSLNSNLERDTSRSRSHSNPQDYNANRLHQNRDVAAYPQNLPITQAEASPQQGSSLNITEVSERLDPLSVLALAGRYMSQNPKDQPDRT